MLKSDLLNYLVEQNILPSELAQEIKTYAVERQQTMVAYLISQQLVNSQELAKAIAHIFALTYFNLDQINDTDIFLSLLPDHFIRDKQVLPIQLKDNILFIAVADPTQQDIFSEVAFRLGKQVEMRIVESDKLAKRIARLLHLQAQENLTDNTPIMYYVEKLLLDAVSKSASDIHIENEVQQMRIRFRIDGILYLISQIPASIAPRLIAHLKVLSQLDITERRLPQDGRFCINHFSGQKIDCRMSVCPTLMGEKIVIRLLNATQQTVEVSALGFNEKQKEFFLKEINRSQGMILVTSPTGSGKTMTLYTALQLRNDISVNISTVEDPVEIMLPGINQVQINLKAGLTFATALRAFLRQDPDIMMVGEIRDQETAEIAIKAAQTGHLVFSTLHTNDAPGTLTRLANIGIAPYHIASAVKLILAQRLVRRLCNFCKKPSSIQPVELSFITYQAVGCSKCQHGYAGRSAIYQLLPMTPKLAEAVIYDHSASLLSKLAREEGMLTLYEAGMEKVQAGVTSLEELTRVIQD